MRSAAQRFTDEWLTPPSLLKALGKFDLDPCCLPTMPWRTAKIMLSREGLEKPWKGKRVWLNPPYSQASHWVEKFFSECKDGIMLLSATSMGSPWSQKSLIHADGVFFLKKKLAFCLPNGKVEGRYLYNVLYAVGGRNVNALRTLPHHEFSGVLMRSIL